MSLKPGTNSGLYFIGGFSITNGPGATISTGGNFQQVNASGTTIPVGTYLVTINVSVNTGVSYYNLCCTLFTAVSFPGGTTAGNFAEPNYFYKTINSQLPSVPDCLQASFICLNTNSINRIYFACRIEGQTTGSPNSFNINGTNIPGNPNQNNMVITRLA
jgi:hypothetical protein